MNPNKWLSKKPKEPSMRSSKPDKLKRVLSSKQRHLPSPSSSSVSLLWTTHVTYAIILAYLDVRKIEYARKIAETISDSKNHILLNSSILNMDLPKERVDYKWLNLLWLNKILLAFNLNLIYFWPLNLLISTISTIFNLVNKQSHLKKQQSAQTTTWVRFDRVLILK